MGVISICPMCKEEFEAKSNYVYCNDCNKSISDSVVEFVSPKLVDRQKIPPHFAFDYYYDDRKGPRLGFGISQCDMCLDHVVTIIADETEEDGYCGCCPASFCFDCLKLLMDWYNENVVRPKVSQMIDEILTEDADVWRELAGC